MKEEIRKIRLCFARLLLFVFMAVVVAPFVHAEDGDTMHTRTVSIDLVCADIYRGDLLQAAERLRGHDGSDPAIDALSQVVYEYKSYSQQRWQKTSEVYSDHMETLADITLSQEPHSIENVELFFEIFVELMELSSGEQKNILLEDPFVIGMLEVAEERAYQFDQKGDWAGALTYYAWLDAIAEDNVEYKESVEWLNERMKVESLLKPDSCQTLAERYSDVDPDMFYNAVKILHLRHVNEIDFDAFANACLERCLLLGEILYDPEMEVDFEYRWDELNAFFDGVYEIREYMFDTAMTSQRFLDIFGIILQVNAETINMPQEVLVAHISEACLSSIDPYTEIIWPSGVKQFSEMISKQFSGIGIQLSKAPDSFKIVDLVLDTPAYGSKLRPNDEVIAINGQSTENMSMDCAGELITGREDTFVTLTVRHAEDDAVEDVSVVRSRITVPTVQGWQRRAHGMWEHFIDDDNGIAYVRIVNFTRTTDVELEFVLDELEMEGIQGLIVDLRGNNGGYFDTAVRIADMFVEDGLIVKRVARRGETEFRYARLEGTRPEYPIVILADDSTASASEIVAGVLTDAKYQRAMIVGQKTYGKGSVITMTHSTGGGSQLWFTGAHYVLPSGEYVKDRHEAVRDGRSDWGIEPDVKVELGERELDDLHQAIRVNEMTQKEDGEVIDRYTIDETLDVDAQLAIGRLIMLTKLIRAEYR